MQALQQVLASLSAIIFALSSQVATRSVVLPSPQGQVKGASDKVVVMKNVSPAFDKYITNPTLIQQQWLSDHFDRMLVYSPSFDSKTSWYPNAWVYVDSYAIYKDSLTFGENISQTHPEWILKDSQGNFLYIPWGCSGGSCPQYAADISNPEYRKWWIGKVKNILTKGSYKGIFIDDVNLDWRIGNGSGAAVVPKDPSTGKEMTISSWRNYFAGFMEEVATALSGSEIVHNSLWNTGALGVNDPAVNRQLAASTYQFVEFGFNDGGITGGTGQWSFNNLYNYIDLVHSKGKGVYFGNLASDSISREFALANYYLISSGMDGLSDLNYITPDSWWNGLDISLGSPLGSRYVWNNLQRRDFSGGTVLVNLPGANTVTVTLPQFYKKLDGTVVNSITLSARQGAVLSLASATSETPITSYVNHNPIGNLEKVDSSGYVIGWAEDSDDLSKPLTIHLYFDGTPDISKNAIVTTASINRSDVGYHGFKAAIPNSLRDGKSHTIDAYALDLTDTTFAHDTHLPGSPLSFVLDSSTTVIAAPPPGNKFIIGDRVYTTDKLKVRLTPTTNGKASCTQAKGAYGTVIGGPQQASGYMWWKLDYDAYCDGWSAENWLVK